jgi:hypothetical protein
MRNHIAYYVEKIADALDVEAVEKTVVLFEGEIVSWLFIRQCLFFVMESSFSCRIDDCRSDWTNSQGPYN